jgi:hypothetical protein
MQKVEFRQLDAMQPAELADYLQRLDIERAQVSERMAEMTREPKLAEYTEKQFENAADKVIGLLSGATAKLKEIEALNPFPGRPVYANTLESRDPRHEAYWAATQRFIYTEFFWANITKSALALEHDLVAYATQHPKDAVVQDQLQKLQLAVAEWQEVESFDFLCFDLKKMAKDLGLKWKEPATEDEKG